MAAGKSVVAIEYVSAAAAVTSVEAQAAAAGIGYYIANPNLQLNGVDTQGFTTGSTTPPPTAPVVTAVQVAPSWADLGTGRVATVTVTFNQAVRVKGTPTLLLNDGGKAAYVSGTGTGVLTFRYQVAAGQNTTRLAVTGVGLPSGASVTNSAGAVANLTKANGNLGGHLIVDTSRIRTTIATGTGQTVNAGTGNDVVTLGGGNATLVFHGNNDVAFLGGGSSAVNATINDQSHGLTVYVLNGGVDRITGLATNSTAVIDLLGGLGGYTSVAQVLAELRPDNAGGTRLSLGSQHSIDIVGVAPGSLHAANFRIG